MNIKILFDKAETARSSSKFPEAERCYRAILRSSPLSALDKADALLGAGDVCRLQGLFRSSIADYRKALSILGNIHHPRSVDAQAGLALALRAMGRPSEALVLLHKTLKFYMTEGDPEGVAFARWALGGTYRIAGDLKNGWKELSIAHSLYRRIGDLEGMAYTDCAIGGLARMRFDIHASEKHYRRANTLMKKRRDTFGIAYSYCGIGNVHRMRHEYEMALVYFRRAEKLYAFLGDVVSYAYTLWSIGTTYKMIGEFSIARDSFEKAHTHFLKTGDTRGQVYTLLGLAEVLRLNDQDTKAKSLITRARRLAIKGRFAWEALHVQAVGSLHNDRPASLSKIRSAYKQAGSRFSPTGFPLNFP